MEFLANLAKRGINLNWLLAGEGSVYAESQKDSGFSPEALVFARELLEAGVNPDDLPELSKDLKKLADLRRDIETKQKETRQAYINLKESFKRKKSEK